MLSDFIKPFQYKQAFDRKKLPTPKEYYLGLDYHFKGKGTWQTTNCPFHEDKRPSLAIHMEKGAFKCFSCGAKGGDVLAFHQQLHKMSFIDACKDLGVWEAT